MKSMKINFHCTDNTSARIWFMNVQALNPNSQTAAAQPVSSVGEIEALPQTVTGQNGVEAERSKWRPIPDYGFIDIDRFRTANVVQLSYGWQGNEIAPTIGLNVWVVSVRMLCEFKSRT